MNEISRIKLPDNIVYDLKDEELREKLKIIFEDLNRTDDTKLIISDDQANN